MHHWILDEGKPYVLYSRSGVIMSRLRDIWSHSPYDRASTTGSCLVVAPYEVYIFQMHWEYEGLITSRFQYLFPFVERYSIDWRRYITRRHSLWMLLYAWNNDLRCTLQSFSRWKYACRKWTIFRRNTHQIHSIVDKLVIFRRLIIKIRTAFWFRLLCVSGEDTIVQYLFSTSTFNRYSFSFDEGNVLLLLIQFDFSFGNASDIRSMLGHLKMISGKCQWTVL